MSLYLRIIRIEVSTQDGAILISWPRLVFIAYGSLSMYILVLCKCLVLTLVRLIFGYDYTEN